MPGRFDVAIVGAGPSGSLLAARLARRGVSVALIDGSHPREKPCGGGVTGRALDLVRNEPGLQALTSVRIASARFVDAATDASAVVPFAADGRAPLIVAARAPFDAMLFRAAEAAGAQAIRSRAVEIRRDGEGFAVATSDGAHLTTAWLVGADGANSLVRRRVARRFSRGELSIATGFFARGVTSREVVIEIVDDPPGYIWSFPRPDHLAIGICAQADRPETSGALRDRVERWIRRTGIADGAALDPYAWPIPSLDADALDRLVVAGNRWLTVGDAAGLVDPITREGIFFALQSATFAADALLHATDPAADYARRVGDEIIGELSRAARFKAGFFRPRFTRLLIDALKGSAGIRRVMADLVAGEQSYRDLKWRLVKTLQWRVAWRVFTATNSRRARERERLGG